MRKKNTNKNANNERLTEKRNEASRDLDKKSIEEIVRLINEEDAKVAGAVNEITFQISSFIEELVERMKKGGKLFYVGSGTSGRIGIIDAVECTPTFSLAEDRVIGIIAGGKEAIFKARENLEDKKELGENRIAEENVRDIDTVLGITASGKTPYVIGAVEKANEAGALTGALVCNHDTELAGIADHSLEVIVGPEILTGSTRMKAGTAQKMVLNTISTTAMVKLGKVYSNLMVDLQASNSKLKKRAIKIFTMITGTKEKIAEKYLGKSDFDVKTAIVMYERGCEKEKAERLLKQNFGNLRTLIG